MPFFLFSHMKILEENLSIVIWSDCMVILTINLLSIVPWMWYNMGEQVTTGHSPLMVLL